MSTALLSVAAAATISRIQFTRFAMAGDRSQATALAPALGDLFESYGNWKDVNDSILNNSSRPSNMMGDWMMGDGMMSSGMMGGMMSRTPEPRSTMQMMMWLPSGVRLVAADADGMIVLDSYRELLGKNIPSRLIGDGIPIPGSRGQIGHVFVGSMIERSLNTLESNYLRSIFLALLAVMVPLVFLSIFFSSKFASRLTKPIVSMSDAAGRISSGDLKSRVDEEGIGEIQILTHRFNDMGEALKRSDEQKRQMIADISHELRTPLTLIRGNLEAILDSVFPMDRDSVESIHTQALQLESLINDLRSLSMLDVGELEFRQDRFELTEIVGKVVPAFEVDAKRKGIHLEYQSSDHSYTVTGDASRLAQVLGNLIANAIRHSPPGGHVIVRQKSLVDGMAVIEVQDDGEGIRGADIDRVFDRFYRSDESRTRETGGTGLGLAISKKIVEAHRGQIGVDSKKGVGSRFWFALPV